MNISGFWSIICALSLSVSASSSAETDAKSDYTLVQAYMDEDELNMFVSGDFNSEDIEVKVANKTAEVYDCGLISEEDITVRTTFLIDNSSSIPINVRDKINELIDNEIKNLEKNEEIKVITFSDTTETLQDFTADRYDLSTAVKGINYSGTQSAVYNAVYDTIPNIAADNGQPCFYRTVVITDGADYANDGITKEELFMRLRADTYPIDVIRVSANKPIIQNKDLSALSRISNGSYSELYPDTNVEQCVSYLSVNDILWINCLVPTNLLDGSTRQVSVSDGVNTMSFDMKMSVVDAPEPPQTESSSSSSWTPPVTSSVVSEVEEEEDEFPLGIVLIIAGAAVVVIAAAVVVTLILTKKKRTRTEAVAQPRAQTQDDYAPTEYIEEREAREHYTIKISNPDNPSDSWVIDVFSDIIIGRADSCSIVIADKSVSREQCKIAANKNGLAISNLSSVNITKLNGTGLATEVLLHPADSIHFGRITLRVDYIQKVADNVPPPPPPENPNDGKTVSIF